MALLVSPEDKFAFIRNWAREPPCVFTCRGTIKPQRKATPSLLRTEDKPAGKGEVVLVIDDEPTIRMLISEVLEEQGYAVVEASDGPSGMRILQSAARIDLLITDVGLPNGMNGRQVADAARQTRPALKVLFITGYAENAVVGNGHLDKGMQVIAKPFAMDVLAQKIRELVYG